MIIKKKIVLIICALSALLVLAVIMFVRYEQNNLVVKKKLTNANVAPITASKTINMQGHWKGEGMREAFVAETVKEFETRNPGDKVNLKWNLDFPNGRAGATEATINQFKTGKIDWDIIWLEPFYYQEIATALNNPNWGKDYLVDFETVPGFKETQKSFILSDPQYRNHMNGIITGPYIEGFYQPFFYNRELTDIMGITVKERGMTFDDLLKYFKQVYDYNKEHGTNYAILYDSGDYKGGIGYGASTWNIFQGLFRSQFESLSTVEDLKPSEVKMIAVRKALGSLEELSKYKPLVSGWQGLNWLDTRNYVLDDKAVFTVCGASWMYSHWYGIDPVKTMKMVPVEMPVYQKVNHYMGGYNPMFAVAKDSPVRDEAVKLLMNFSTANSSEKWVRYAKAPSGVKGNVSTAGNVSKNPDQFDDFISYINNKYGGNVYDSKTVNYILGDKYKDLTLQFTMHLGDVMDGNVTAEQAYMAILSDMKAVDDKQ